MDKVAYYKDEILKVASSKWTNKIREMIQNGQRREASDMYKKMMKKVPSDVYGREAIIARKIGGLERRGKYSDHDYPDGFHDRYVSLTRGLLSKSTDRSTKGLTNEAIKARGWRKLREKFKAADPLQKELLRTEIKYYKDKGIENMPKVKKDLKARL